MKFLIIELTGLELAKYILLRLVYNNEFTEHLAEDFDNDVRFINSIMKFIKDVRMDQTG